MNENEVDIDAQDDFEQAEPAGKPSLKEAWQSNPLLKIAAAVIVLAVVVGGYMTLTKPNPADEAKSLVGMRDTAKVKAIPGQTALDTKYKEALQQRNEQAAKTAAETGRSAIPVPIATGKAQTLDVPRAAGDGDTDPLKEWKQSVQSKQLKAEAPRDDENPAPQSDLVPMVQPVHPQPTMKMDPKAAGALSAQMRTILTAQTPAGDKHIDVTKEETPYIQMRTAQKKKEAESKNAAKMSGGAMGSAGGAMPQAEGKVITPAGQIIYAQLLTELNSDVPAPALALVLSGPFAGGRALGKMTTEDEYIVITFDRIVKDTVSYKINGIALDEATTLPAQQTSIDHHYFSRIILPAAAKFVSGYGSSISQTGTSSTVTSGGAVAQSQPKPDAKESVYKGLQEATDEIGKTIKEDAKSKPTIKVARGTTMGVLFLDSVKTTDADK